MLIEAAELPHPRRGDLLAVPATGAYTLAMGSNYNGVPRPAVVLVRDGEARVIRRRETVDDLLRYDTGTLDEMKRLSTIPGVVLVSIAAAMWGLDGLIRKPLSHSTSPATIVFGEHVVLVALTLPLLVVALRALWAPARATSRPGSPSAPARRRSRRSSSRRRSSTATSSRVLVLQKAQPLVAVVGRVARPRRAAPAALRLVPAARRSPASG